MSAIRLDPKASVQFRRFVGAAERCERIGGDAGETLAAIARSYGVAISMISRL